MDTNYTQYKLSTILDDCLKDKTTDETIYIDKLMIDQYFPYKSNINYDKLMIDTIGKYSITLPRKADDISRIIKDFCLSSLIKINFDKKLKKIRITDATAGVGGNVLSFCKHKFEVKAIELDSDRYKYLLNNIKEYGYKVDTYNCDYLTIYDKLEQDIIYMDPPWGGIEYKKEENITLRLGNIAIEELCILISDKKLSKYTILKLPFNYNLNHIKDIVKLPLTIFTLKNILLVIITN